MQMLREHYADGMFLVTRHLILQGHTRIAYIGGRKGHQAFAERYEGYCDAFVDSGMAIDESMVLWDDYSESSGYRCALNLVAMAHLPTAVCTANDILALGLLRALDERGIRIPQDMSIVSMDNIDVAARLKPRLSSVAISQYEIGRAAAQMRLRRLDGETPPPLTVVFTPRLIVRESSVVLKS